MSKLERADSVSVPSFTRADTAPRAAAATTIRGPSYAGAGSLRPAPNVMHKPFANIIPALAPAAHIPAYAAPPKTSRPASASAVLTHKTAGVQAAAASAAAAAAADACERSRFKILALETGQVEDTTMNEVERMSLILKKWGYRERMSQAAGNSRDERAMLLKISQNMEMRECVHTEFERFMILAREETARMSAEVKKLFALSMAAAAKLEALDHEEAELMAAANTSPPHASAAADAVALAASGYMASTQSRTHNSSNAPAPTASSSHATPDEQIFSVDFSLAGARSRLAALDVSSAPSSAPLTSQAASQQPSPAASSHITITSGSVRHPAAAEDSDGLKVSRAAETSLPSVADVRKDIAAKRRLALQQATQMQ